MSDEQPQPSLRLKPRSAPATTPPPDTPASVPDSSAQPPDALPASEASAALNDPMRLRLKPKTPPPEGSPADTSGVTFATPQPFATAPTPAAEDTPATLPPEPPALPPIAEYVPPPQPVAHAAPYVPTPSNLNEAPRTPGRSDKAQHAYKADKWLAAVVIFVLVLAGAIYGVRFLMKANPKQKTAARVSASTESKPASPEPTPAAPGQSRLVEKPTSSAGKAVAKVRDLVASREKFDKEQGVEHVLADTPDAVPANPSANVVSIVQPAKPEPAAPEPEPELPPIPPSDAFRQFVISMRVNGVFQGENARAMINGKMYQLGDIVDARLGITFFKIDVENKQLIFRDENTAIMPRRY